MAYTTLIQAKEVETHLANPAWAVVDCRFKLDAPAWGAARYAESHIPGAVYADLDRDLSGAKTGRNGRHPLPEPAALQATFSRLGIDASVQVVAYDQDSGMFASRLWWLLRWLGHDRVAVLDGGFAAWTSAGLPTRSGVESRPPRTFTGAPRQEMIVSAADITSLLHRSDHRLVDARAPERFSGAVEPIDQRAGHIPGATNLHYQSNLDSAGRFRTPAALRERLDRALGDAAPENVISYCGSGVTACHNILAMEHAGLTGARLYPGSWSEWSSDPERPVEKGP